MKKLTNILDKSNLRPRERILLCIQAEVERSKTGKTTLTDADIFAISRSWKPKNHQEASEYNNYFETWDIIRIFKLDAQMIYLNALVALESASALCMMALYDSKTTFKQITHVLNEESNQNALFSLLNHTGIEYEALLHTMTLQNISKELHNDILSLDPDAETEYTYFYEEEKIYNIFSDNKDISSDDVEEIVSLVDKAVGWDSMNTFYRLDNEVSEAFFTGYFSSIPIIEIVKETLSRIGIIYTDDKNVKETLYTIKNSREILKETVREKVNDGSLFSEYPPLCKSAGHNTYEGTPTHLTHAEVIQQYVIEKTKVRKQIDSLIATDKLSIKNQLIKIGLFQKEYLLITGSSIYSLTDDFEFKKSFIKQIEILQRFSFLIEIIKCNKDFITQYGKLLYIKDILSQASILFETDITFYLETYFSEIDSKISLLNYELNQVYNTLEAELYGNPPVTYPVIMDYRGMSFNPENFKPVRDETFEHAIKEINKIWSSHGNREALVLPDCA